MIVDKNIVVVGSIDWDTNWQTQQRLVWSLSKYNKILFIENTGVRNLRVSDYQRIKDRLNNWKKSTKGFRQINKNIYIYSPLIIPFPHSLICSWINAELINFYIKKWSLLINFNVDIFITFLPTRLSYALMNFFKSNINIYYCANEMTGNDNLNKNIINSEINFFKNCDHTFVIAKNLLLKAKKYSKNISILSSGVEFNKFNYFKTKKNFFTKSKLVVGYVGSVTEVFDINLIEYLSIKNPQLNFIIVGRIYTNVSKLKKIKNIFFISEIEHSRVPSYMKGFNVGIIPYKVNNFTNSVYSCKLNEYLAMGLPVISTNIKESILYNKKNNNIISVARNYYEFNDLLNIKIKNNNRYSLEKRIAVAKKNSWDIKFAIFQNILSLLEIKKSFLRYSWKRKFKSYCNDFFYQRFFRFFFIFLTLVIIFFSPIIMIVGDKLVVKDQIVKAEYIIVISGSGDVNYNNISYQNRYRDINNIVNSFKFYPYLILAGKKYILRESEIIKSTLIYKNNFPENKIYIIDEKIFFNSYEQIINIGNFLKKKTLKKLFF